MMRGGEAMLVREGRQPRKRLVAAVKNQNECALAFILVDQLELHGVAPAGLVGATWRMARLKRHDLTRPAAPGTKLRARTRSMVTPRKGGKFDAE